jgi:hypothetical protein
MTSVMVSAAVPWVAAVINQSASLQFVHAAPVWVFQLWTWSFLLIMVLGFFNLLLAMLLDALASAQDEQRVAPGVVKEMCEIVNDLAFRARGAVLPRARKMYMSDTQLRELLLERRFRTLPEQELREVVSHVFPDVPHSTHLPHATHLLALAKFVKTTTSFFGPFSTSDHTFQLFMLAQLRCDLR